ncbi:hypothetical protein OKW46_000001, partial [Paraburkholderia sp. WSM4179]|uniref:hypothetical protein n=1 Tax=Paraburkholderia sp. WSM4179 TaxID=2991073 RepID=UPI000A2EECAC|nr:hypothetical protein [Paraburkholderia sp. WSM4179]MDH6146079.1 hypothetical protein [Paraburkholderia sp. WSM4179]
MQLELWPRERLSSAELAAAAAAIRNLYWHIRNMRRGVQDARRRQVYRKIALHKKRLLMAGVSKREVLDFLACCRARQCRDARCIDCVQPAAQPAHPI